MDEPAKEDVEAGRPPAEGAISDFLAGDLCKDDEEFSEDLMIDNNDCEDIEFKRDDEDIDAANVVLEDCEQLEVVEAEGEDEKKEKENSDEAEKDPADSRLTDSDENSETNKEVEENKEGEE